MQDVSITFTEVWFLGYTEMEISTPNDLSVQMYGCYSIFSQILEQIASLPPFLIFTLILRDSFCAHSC